MKPFSFRLQTKLKITSIYEDVAREELQDKLSSRDKIAGRLNLLNQKMSELEQSIRSLGNESDTYQRMVVSREYIPVLQAKKASVISELNTAEERVEEARSILMNWVRETSTLEKIKERDWSKYRYEVNLEEQKHIDESAIRIFYRKRYQSAAGIVG